MSQGTLDLPDDDFDPERALEPDAPLVHPGRDGGNLLARALVEKGDAPGAFAGCDVVVEGLFETPMQDHVFLEPPNGAASSPPTSKPPVTCVNASIPIV